MRALGRLLVITPELYTKGEKKEEKRGNPEQKAVQKQHRAGGRPIGHGKLEISRRRFNSRRSDSPGKNNTRIHIEAVWLLRYTLLRGIAGASPAGVDSQHFSVSRVLQGTIQKMARALRHYVRAGITTTTTTASVNRS